MPNPTRRTVLGTAMALGGGALTLAVADPAAAAPATASAAAPASAASPSDRHIHFHAWDGHHDLATGTHQGTKTNAHGMWLHKPSSTRAYVDPFGDGSSVTYDQATWTSDVVRLPFGLTELISSWNADTPDGTWIEVLVRGTDQSGTRSGWYVLGRWCSNDPEQGGAIHRCSLDGQKTDAATVYTDTFAARGATTFVSYQLQVNLLRRQGTRLTPTLSFLSAVASNLPSAATVPVSPPGVGCGITRDVPPLSQELHVGEYPQYDNGGEAWCSPTSTSMILQYWHTGPSRRDLAWVTAPKDPIVDFSARNVYDYEYEGCGNWPFNPAYAARFGLQGFVTRLRSLTEAEAFIKAGIPLVASVSFKKGALTGAGYGTNGHLLVIVGFTASGDVVVNDPASHLIPDDAQVRVVYNRAEFENTWVPHSGGTVYVMRPPSVALPRVMTPAEPNW